jgi:hypothetical protein
MLAGDTFPTYWLSVWNLWCTKWHWAGFSCSMPVSLSVSLHRCSILSHSCHWHCLSSSWQLSNSTLQTLCRVLGSETVFPPLLHLPLFTSSFVHMKAVGDSCLLFCCVSLRWLFVVLLCVFKMAVCCSVVCLLNSASWWSYYTYRRIFSPSVLHSLPLPFVLFPSFGFSTYTKLNSGLSDLLLYFSHV